MIKDVVMRDGEVIQVCTVGSGDRKVMLVHGIGGSHHTWLPFITPFLMDFTFVIPNLRGFGLSSDTPYNNPDVIANYADDMEDIVKHFIPRGEQYILVALSMGAFSSMCFLSRDVNRSSVLKYLNIDQAPMAMNSDSWECGLIGDNQDLLMEMTDSLMKSCKEFLHSSYDETPIEFKRNFNDALTFFFTSAFHRKYEKLLVKIAIHSNLKIIHRIFSTHKFKSYHDCMYAYRTFAHDFRPALKNFKFPVTVFAGKHSEMYPVEGQKYIANAVPMLTKYVEFNESHALMFTSPLKFVKEFRKFLYNI
jgi:non-heme chloroperoxidase